MFSHARTLAGTHTHTQKSLSEYLRQSAGGARFKGGDRCCQHSRFILELKAVGSFSTWSWGKLFFSQVPAVRNFHRRPGKVEGPSMLHVSVTALFLCHHSVHCVLCFWTKARHTWTRPVWRRGFWGLCRRRRRYNHEVVGSHLSQSGQRMVRPFCCCLNIAVPTTTSVRLLQLLHVFGWKLKLFCSENLSNSEEASVTIWKPPVLANQSSREASSSLFYSWLLYEKPGFQGGIIPLEEGAMDQIENMWTEEETLEPNQTDHPAPASPMVIGSLRLAVRVCTFLPLWGFALFYYYWYRLMAQMDLASSGLPSFEITPVRVLWCFSACMSSSITDFGFGLWSLNILFSSPHQCLVEHICI